MLVSIFSRKHVLGFVLSALCCALLFVACGDPGNGAGEEKSATSEQGNNSEPAANPDKGGTDASTLDKANPDNAAPKDEGTDRSGHTDKGTPDKGNTDKGNPDKGNPDEGTPDENVPPKPCQSDCDCVTRPGYVCNDKKVCAKDARPPICPNCSSPLCPEGRACLSRDGSIGTCPPPQKCKSDCDCVKRGLLCGSNNTCQPLKRRSNCKACNDPTCKPGSPCVKPDKSPSTCGTACKHDCDCRKLGLLCGSGGTCLPLKRRSYCLSCSGACKKGDKCYNKDNSIGICAGAATPCKHDCDCRKLGLLCGSNGTCLPLKRRSYCLSCGGACKKGDKCYNKDNSIGICGGTAPTTCKHDCDCRKLGLLCGSNGTCQPLRRISYCLSCGGACKKGDKCYNKDNSIGICAGAAIPCKHDCDCLKAGLLCGGGTCQPLKRISYCLSCSGSCKPGDKCYNKDKSIGICKSKTTACKHDCDCLKVGLLCGSNGTCQPLRRVSFCKSCTGNCTKGDPCYTKTKAIAKCGATACKNDCECVKFGLICTNGYCQSVTRKGTCISCQGLCQKGDPCYDPKTLVIGICKATALCTSDCDCPTTQICDNRACKSSTTRKNNCPSCTSKCTLGQACRNKDGSKGSCCCTASGCKTGQVCCNIGGSPPPGICTTVCKPSGPGGKCP